MSGILVKSQENGPWRCKNTHHFHALTAWWLRDGVLDEPVRGEGLQWHGKCNYLVVTVATRCVPMVEVGRECADLCGVCSSCARKPVGEKLGNRETHQL